jgi:carboxymethylenebutenolidase
MGGAMVMRAAAHYPDRIVAAASFHGAALGAKSPDSPHQLASRIRAKLHIGLAETDFWMPPEMIDRLTTALDTAGVDYQAAVYPGTPHGWTLADTPEYQREGTEHHWDRLLTLYHETLQTR